MLARSGSLALIRGSVLWRADPATCVGRPYLGRIADLGVGDPGASLAGRRGGCGVPCGASGGPPNWLEGGWMELPRYPKVPGVPGPGRPSGGEVVGGYVRYAREARKGTWRYLGWPGGGGGRALGCEHPGSRGPPDWARVCGGTSRAQKNWPRGICGPLRSGFNPTSQLIKFPVHEDQCPERQVRDTGTAR